MNPELGSTSPNVFAAALQWLEGTLLGTVATAVAVIAVASIGFMLLSARIDMRRGVQVVLGCFILFGASTIASGIIQAVTGAAGTDQADSIQPAPPLLPAATEKVPIKAVPFDPYAGAAVPPRP